MAYLIETNLLMRLANSAGAEYEVAQRAIARLHRQGESLRTAPQNLIEFRNSATRPTTVNGLGYTTGMAETYAARFEAAPQRLARSDFQRLSFQPIRPIRAGINRRQSAQRLTRRLQDHAV